VREVQLTIDVMSDHCAFKTGNLELVLANDCP